MLKIGVNFSPKAGPAVEVRIRGCLSKDRDQLSQSGKRTVAAATPLEDTPRVGEREK